MSWLDKYEAELSQPSKKTSWLDKYDDGKGGYTSTPKPEYQSAPDKYRQNEVVQQPNQDLQNTLGYKLAQFGVDKSAQGNWVNDKVVGTVNAGAGIAKTLADLVSPGGTISRNIDGFIQGGKDIMTPERQAADASYNLQLAQAKANGGTGIGVMAQHYKQNPSVLIEDGVGNALPFLLTGGTLGAAGLGAASGAGTVRGGIYDNTQALDDTYLQNNNADYRTLRKTLSESQAKEKIGSAILPNAPMIAGGAATGLLTGATGIGRMLSGKGGSPIRAALSEIGGEALDEASQQLLSNAGTKFNVNPNHRLSDDLALNAFGGALIGAPGGVVAGVGTHANNKRAATTQGNLGGMFTKPPAQTQPIQPQAPQNNKSAPLVGAIRKAGVVGMPRAMSGLDALGSLISRGEGNYNSYNSGTKGVAGGVIGHSGQRDLSSMSISDILNTDGLSGNDKNRVFAAGKYQVTIPTLRGAVKALGLNGSEKFTPQLQERIFKEYLIHKAGGGAVTRYLNGTGSLHDAQIGLAQEWRSFADPRTGKTYSDNAEKANKASISADESARILTAIKNGGDLSSFMNGNPSIDSQPFDAKTQQFDAESALQDYQDELQSQLEDMQAAQEQAYADQQNAYDERMSELQDKLDALQGADTEVEVSGKYEPSQWMIQEADSLGATMDKADNQLRDRNRVASDMQINEMANNLDYRKLMDSPMMDYGAPTLTNDGKKVIGGNGRVAAIKRAYESGKADTYREQIKANAGRFGFTPEQVAQYKKPVLTRRFKNFVDTQKAAIASNEGGGLSMSALEQTKVDASRLPPLSAFSVNDTGELNTAANRDAIRAFVGAFPTNQQAALIGSDGQLSQSGVARLRNAILHKAYGDSDTLGRMVESTDQGSRNIVNALTQSAPNVADVKDGIAKGELHNADITDDVLQAVEILNQIKADGGTIRAYLSQHNLLDEHMSVAARKLLRFFDANLNSAKKIRELIGAYNDALRAQGNPNQGDVFGDKVTVDKNQLLDKVLKDHGQQQSELDNSGRTENGQSARYEQSIGAPDNETQGRPDSGRGDAQSNRTSGEQGQSERGRIDRGQSNDLTLTGQTESEIAHTESQIKLAEKQRELAEKKLEAQRAQDELHKTVQQRNESANDNFTLGQSAEDNVSGQDAMFIRASSTRYTKDIINVDGVDRPTTNADGKSIHTTEDGLRNFWRWFGGSKVVDDKGRPLVVYHGTREDFNNFDANKNSTKFDNGFLGRGFYFSTSWETSSGYAKMKDGSSSPNIMPVYLSIQNPIRLTLDSKFTKIGLIRKELGLPYDKSFETVTPDAAQTISDELRKLGYDGVMLDYPDRDKKTWKPNGKVRETEIVSLSPNQIKSATGNNGDFSSDNNDIRYSRSADTQAKYEARIDSLFDGKPAGRVGVTVLDKSDVLDMLGYGGKPVVLQESKVIRGMDAHQAMTADVWKKIPDWVENPVAVFKSDTVDGRLVFIAPEMVAGSPALIIIEPNADISGELNAHLMVNAYDATGGKTPYARWMRDGMLKYVNKQKFPVFASRVGLRLSEKDLQNKQGSERILTEKNLSGYRKSQQSVNQSNEIGQKTTGNTVSSVRQNIAKMFGVTDLSGLPNLSVMQSATPEVLAKIENGTFSQIGNESIQGAYDPKTGKIFIFADAIPQGQERGVFLHEVFHKRGRELMGEHYSRLKSFVDGWADSKGGTVERDIYTAAKARADASGETGARYDDELIAYSIEEAVNRGVEPNVNEIDNGTAQGFMGRVRQLFTNVMKKMHPSFNGKFTADDLVTIAHAAAGLEIDTQNNRQQTEPNSKHGFENAPAESIAHEERVYKEGKIFNQAGEFKLGKAAYDKLADVAKSNYSPLSWLKFVSNKPAVFTSIMHDYRAENTKFQRAAQDIANESKSFDAIERKVLKELLTNELEFDTVPPEHIVQVANEIRTLLNNQTDELVANGMLSRESAERWRDSYLPRFYDKQADLFGGVKQGLNFIKSARAAMRIGMDGSHLKGRGIFKSVPKGSEAQYEAQGWEVRGQDSNGNPVVWRDYTKAERANMNENQDGIMSFTAGYMQTQADLAKARLFKRIAENEDLASKTYRQDWVQIPDIPIADTGIRKFGALGGMFVHPEVYDHMKNEFGFANQGALLKTWRKALGYWKATKTVYNPVAHMNNMVSNVSMLWLAGGNPQDLVRGCRDLIKKQGYYDEAIDAGLIGDGVDSAAIRDMFGGVQNVKEHGALMNYLAEKSANWHVLKPLTALKEAAEKAYRTEDEVFKFSLYTQQRNKGMSVENAREYANQFFFDYTDMPQGLRVLRDTGVLPFISYTSKAIPAIMRATLTRPHRMLAWVGAAHAINALSYMVLGAAGDEEEEKKNMPEYRQGMGLWGMPRQIRLPWNDDGKAAFIDITRMVPLGDFTDTTNQQGGLPLPNWMMPNGPVLGAFSVLALNKDPFTGDEFKKSYETVGDASGRYAKWLLSQWLPSSVVVPFSYHTNNVLDGVKSQFENTWVSDALEAIGYSGRKRNGDVVKLDDALRGSIGIKTWGFNPQEQAAKDMRRKQFEAREIKSDMSRTRKDSSLTAAQKADKLNAQRQSLERLFTTE